MGYDLIAYGCVIIRALSRMATSPRRYHQANTPSYHAPCEAAAPRMLQLAQEMQQQSQKNLFYGSVLDIVKDITSVPICNPSLQ